MKIGLVFADTSIKIVKVIGKRPLLAKIPLEKGIIVEGEVKDASKLKNTLFALSRKLDLVKGEIVLGISEKYIFSKSITVSDGGIDLEDKINAELESYVPQGAESYIDWQRSEKSDDGETIFVASAPKALLNGYLDVFASLRIPIAGIEPLAFALVRHIPKAQLPLPSPSKQEEQKTPPPPLPPSHPPSNAVSTLIVNLEENEILLTIANEKNGIELTSVLSQEMIGHENELLLEISNMRSFYDKKSEDTKIGRVLLTGERITDALKQQISANLGIAVNFLRIPENSINPADALSFFAYFALTDLPVVYPKNHEHVNLLPSEMLLTAAKAKKAAYQRKLMRAATMVFGICFFLYAALFGFLFWNRYTLELQIEKEKEALRSGKSGQLNDTASAVNKYIAIVRRVKSKEDVGLSTLSFLADKTPGGITITHYLIHLTEGSVVLNGQSLERETLLGFKQVLEEEKFQKVAIPLTSLEKKGATNFSLSFESTPSKESP